jgi:hypothetical protein
MAPVKLSNGVTELLPGMKINMANAAMARDSAYYENLEQFIGDRFFAKTSESSGKTDGIFLAKKRTKTKVSLVTSNV